MQNSKNPSAVHVYIGEDENFLAEGEDEIYYDIELYPKSIITVSSSHEIEFYSKMF